VERFANRGDASALAETAEFFSDTAVLAPGGVPEEPAKFAGLLADRLARTVQYTPPRPKSRVLLFDCRRISNS
jgi:hypothetical protein